MDGKRFSHEGNRETPEVLPQTGEIPEFSRLRFENLSWQEGGAEGGVPIYRAETAIATRGKTLFLQASNRVYTGETGDLSSLMFSVRASPESSADVHLFLNISDRGNDPYLKASISVGRSEGTEDMPPGLGIATYEKSLDFLSAVSANKPLFHREIAAPDDGDLEKWNARFAPVLRNRGYQQVDATTWEKVYPATAA